MTDDELRELQKKAGWPRLAQQFAACPQLGLELAQLESITPREMTCAVEASLSVPDRSEHDGSWDWRAAGIDLTKAGGSW